MRRPASKASSRASWRDSYPVADLKPKPSEDAHTEEFPAISRLFQKLEALERDLEPSLHTAQHRWMVPYADLLTLLLGLFLVLLTSHQTMTQTGASRQMPVPKISRQAEGVQAQKESLQFKSFEQKADVALEQKLKQRLKFTGLEIKTQPRGVVLSLKENILFAPGSATLSPQAKKTLASLTHQLKQMLSDQPRRIRVEGHTDNTPIRTSLYPSNWELSTARATCIVRYWVENKGFSPALLSASGYGEFKPLTQNSSIEGKRKNRRVDIVILNEKMIHQEPPGLKQENGSKSLFHPESAVF